MQEDTRLTLEELLSSTTKMYSMPDVYFRVKALVDDPDSVMADLARVIGTDPGLTARLLKLANSAVFGMSARVDTVSKAVNLLGMQQVHDLVLATSITQTFAHVSSTVMDMPHFWRRSVHCGVLARVLASACNVLDGERLFVAGLLHDLGHLIMYQGVPELAQAALLQAEREEMPLFRVERGLLGFDYAQVGAALMRAWKLPRGLEEAVELHPEPARAESYAREVSLVHIAAHLAASAYHDGQPASTDEAAIDPVVWGITGLNPADLAPLQEAANRQFAEVAGLIMP
jgi:HD-like signal output (HDOD) protein